MFEKIRENIKEKMMTTLEKLRKVNPLIPQETKGFITEFHIARILAETGPLDDFQSIRQLYRYAGLNIREYQSCQMKGANRTCKKGRSRLRKSLAMIVLPMVKKGRFYGDYYHERKAKGAIGNKLMVNLQRKFLKSFYGLYKSGVAFDSDRVFVCESKTTKAA
jgi:transposase